jgi:hypothetical protein
MHNAEAICFAKQISIDGHFTPLADLTGKAQRGFSRSYEWREVVKVLDRKGALYTRHCQEAESHDCSSAH